MRVRFAPSPTGHLHVGNARTALFNWLLAHGKDGTFILRIEDTDAERSTRESETGILEDLRWLGLDWDEGPDVDGQHGPYRQSERLHLYASYANELLAAGHAYHCFCSPTKLEADRQADLAAGRPPRYRGTCRGLSREEAQVRIDRGERPVVRFKVPENVEVTFHDLVRGDVTFNSEVISDPVIVRSDGRPAYNFAVVVDDALMKITHVIRGEDHISNTPRQVLIYRALGFSPPEFAHLSLVMGPDHTPLSKRHGATSVAEFRQRGYLPEALVNYLALIGWSPGGDEELLPVDELARRFALGDVGHSAGVFDVEKLAWMNRYYMKAASPARLAAEAARYFVARGYFKRRTDGAMDYLVSLLPMTVGSVDRLDGAITKAATIIRRLIEERREADHEGNPRECLGPRFRMGRGGERVGVVQQQRIDRRAGALGHRFGELTGGVSCSERGRRPGQRLGLETGTGNRIPRHGDQGLERWIVAEQHPPGAIDVPHQNVEAVHRQGAEQPVRIA